MKIWVCKKIPKNKLRLYSVPEGSYIAESYTLIKVNAVQYKLLFDSAEWKLVEGTYEVLETNYDKNSKVLRMYNDIVKTKHIVVVNKRFKSDVVGTSMLIRNAERTRIYIAKRNGADITSINIVCVDNELRTKFFNDVRTARGGTFCDKYALTPSDAPMFNMWNNIMTTQYFEQLKRYNERNKA